MPLLQTIAEFIDVDRSPLKSTYTFVPLNIIINAQKLGALFFMFFLMCYYDNFSKGAWVYLGLHGSYGIMWVTKDVVFPDKTFQKKVGLFELIAVSVILLLYYTMGFQMMSGVANNDPSNERIFICIMMYVTGVVLMMCVDIQKYVRLQHKTGPILIDDLLLSNNRNTNYTGEMLLYASFAVLVNEYAGFIVLLTVWCTLFFSRMYLKEMSLSKKKGYETYAKNSYCFMFKFFKSDLANIVFYCGFAYGSFVIYHLGGIEAFVKIIKSKF